MSDGSIVLVYYSPGLREHAETAAERIRQTHGRRVEIVDLSAACSDEPVVTEGWPARVVVLDDGVENAGVITVETTMDVAASAPRPAARYSWPGRDESHRSARARRRRK